MRPYYNIIQEKYKIKTTLQMTPPHASVTHQNHTKDCQADDRRHENEKYNRWNSPLDLTADKTYQHKYILIII